jgi:hypothetical protein
MRPTTRAGAWAFTSYITSDDSFDGRDAEGKTLEAVVGFIGRLTGNIATA